MIAESEILVTNKGTYTQCLFVSFDHNGTEPISQLVSPDILNKEARPFYEYVAWIPTKFAQQGRVLVLKGVHGNWRVQEVWGTRDAKWVELKSWDHTRQRKASDI